jgi:hypothetical protein
MNTSPLTAQPPAPASRILLAGLLALAAYQLALALFMAVAPQVFYTAIGPFGARNDHYVRDVASFSAALGAGLAIAVRRPSWRVPMLAVTTLQFALHSLNHLLDIGAAHPSWTGYADFFSLAATTLLLAWLWRMARSESSRPAGSAAAERELLRTSPTTERRLT